MTVFVSFDYVYPFLGDAEALPEGVEVVANEETLPSLADMS